MVQALEGMLVVSLEQAVAAPLCTARLVAAGARVIKVERPEGDFAREYDHVVHGESAYFLWLNGGKESLVLDLRLAEDAALLHRIVARADIFVQNLAPGAADRLGFGSAALRAAHPALITCDKSGYGEDGPYRDMKAYDLLIQCESGLADITGTAEGPGRVGVSVADIGCGINAFGAIMEAVVARMRTGEGRSIQTSLFAGLADWMTVPLLHHDYGCSAPVRGGIRHPSIAPYGAFQTGDGRSTVLSIQNEREWQAFCETVLERADLAADPRFASNGARCANRPALEAMIGAIFVTLDQDRLAERLTAAGVAFGRLNSVADFSQHPQLQRVAVATPSGPVLLPAPPVHVAGQVPATAAVPALGAHTRSIAAEFA
jgi:itaconate CoA-transferase